MTVIFRAKVVQTIASVLSAVVIYATLVVSRIRLLRRRFEGMMVLFTKCMFAASAMNTGVLNRARVRRISMMFTSLMVKEFVVTAISLDALGVVTHIVCVILLSEA